MKTNEQFLIEVNQLRGSEYTFLEPYQGATTKIKVRHNVCGHEYYVKPNLFLSKKIGCPKCHKVYRKTHDEFVAEVDNKFGDEFTIIGEFKGMTKRILTRHKCGYEWEPFANNLLRGNGCPKCKGKKLATVFKTDFDDVRKYISSFGFELLSQKYDNAHEKLIIMCPKGHIYESTFNHFKTGYRCPICRLSKGEEKIKAFLDNIGIAYQQQFIFDDLRNSPVSHLRFDFAVFDYDGISFLIEYDGEQHFRPIPFGGNNSADLIHAKTKENDGLKNKYCEDNSIKLLRIPYWDFDNIEQILKEAI